MQKALLSEYKRCNGDCPPPSEVTVAIGKLSSFYQHLLDGDMIRLFSSDAWEAAQTQTGSTKSKLLCSRA